MKEIFFAVFLFIFAKALSSCGEWGPLFIAAHGVLSAVASLVTEHRLRLGLSSCGTWSWLLRDMWNLP